MNELHAAARVGSINRAAAVLSRGELDIDEQTPNGFTALMIAANFGHLRTVSFLLSNGADLSIGGPEGLTALHCSAKAGHLAVTKLLVKAGADLDAKISSAGFTPLYLAAEGGCVEIMGVLIEAGANPNSGGLDGGPTPLYIAAVNGQLAATKVLLREKANPLLAFLSPSGATCIPLDAAARMGHLEVVQELIQEYGIEGCSGASGGVDALEGAAENQHLEIMGMLTSAGVVDTGKALTTVATFGLESSVKFLLQQQEWKASGQGACDPDTINHISARPLVCSIQACRPCSSPRIARLLVEAGADTATAVPLTDAEGRVVFNDTPLALANEYLRVKRIGGKYATESQLHTLEAMRRLLLRVEAVHAISWLWVRDAPSITHAAAEGTGGATMTAPTPLLSMLPVLRRRAGTPRVLLAALFRNSTKP